LNAALTRAETANRHAVRRKKRNGYRQRGGQHMQRAGQRGQDWSLALAAGVGSREQRQRSTSNRRSVVCSVMPSRSSRPG